MREEIERKKNEALSTWFRKDNDSEWQKHVEEMNHQDYPYRVAHWKAVSKYEGKSAEAKRRPGGIYGLREGGIMQYNFCSIIEAPKDISKVFEKIVTKREGLSIMGYLPHFVAIKNPASMIYLLSCPRLECSNDVERAMRTQIAQWICLQKEEEHSEGLYYSTHFHSKFWSEFSKEGGMKMDDPWGFIAYGVEMKNPKSREEDKCTLRAYKANCRNIQKLVSDTYRFCNIVRADSDPDGEWRNGYQKLERTIGRQIDDLARAIAQSPNPDVMVMMSNLPTSGYSQSNLPQVSQPRKGLISKIKGLLE